MNGKKKTGIIISLALFPVVSVYGQLHESIKVDGKYIPDVIRVDRINAFPKVVKSTVATTPIGYEERGVAASFNPTLMVLPATGWRAKADFSTNPGYLEFGVGSWLNSTLSAGYRFIDNKDALFGVRLQHNSTSLWKPDVSEVTHDEKQYRYDESVGLYGSYNFTDYGRLDAAIDYHYGSFNYYGFRGSEGSEAVPGQRLNDVALRLDWISEPDPTNGLRWNVGGRMRHFAYRELVTPYQKEKNGAAETNIGFDGGVSLAYGDNSHIGIDGNLDFVSVSQKDLDNYAMLTLIPYYRFTKGKMDVRLGAEIDLSFRAGLKGDRYPFLHVAPDVRFGIQSGKVGFYIDVLGGSRMNTLAHLHQLDYYGLPAALTTRPVYTPLDAAIGLNFGPFSGFSFGFKGRYKVSYNVPLGGWYTAWLNNASAPMEGMEIPDLINPEVNYCTSSDGIDLHGYSASAFLRYDYGRTFSASAEGTYQPQDGKTGYFNGYDRPGLTGNFRLSFRPLEKLGVNLGFDYRGDRKIYTTATGIPAESSSGLEMPETEFCSLKLPDLNLLNLSLSWDFSKNFTIWLQGDNLLNRHDEYLPMQPTQGVVIVAGLKLLF